MQQDPFRGIALKVASVVVFVCMASLVKVTAPTIPPGQQVFCRSLFALPVIFAWLRLRSEPARVLRTARPLSHLARGTVGTTAMALGFAANGLLPLPEVTALGYAAPLMTVIFAALLLGERVRAFRLGAVFVGLGGVLIILWPRLGGGGALTSGQSLGALLAVLGACCSGLAYTFVRRLAMTEATATIVFWFTVTSTMLSLLTLPFGWVLPDAGTAALLVTIGLMGGLGQILLTSAYRFADASLVAPFEYASMLFAVAIGYAVFAEVPNRATIMGAIVIIAAGVAIILRERHLGVKRTRERRALTPQG